jgi:hypothetical protein
MLTVEFQIRLRGRKDGAIYPRPRQNLCTLRQGLLDRASQVRSLWDRIHVEVYDLLVGLAGLGSLSSYEPGELSPNFSDLGPLHRRGEVGSKPY